MLTTFLRVWLGAWPPAAPGLTVIGHPARERPRWDGAEQLAVAVSDADGDGVLSVPPAARAEVAALLAGVPAGQAAALVAARLPALLGRPTLSCINGVFRSCEDPPAMPGAGAWEPSDGPGVPGWLRPFPGEVLIARDDDGAYLAGVGLKRHDVTGVEIAVGTEERARGQGLARRLVARATRRILAGGAVAIYLHDPANLASARVAEAAGFADRGWRIQAVGGTV